MAVKFETFANGHLCELELYVAHGIHWDDSISKIVPSEQILHNLDVIL